MLHSEYAGMRMQVFLCTRCEPHKWEYWFRNILDSIISKKVTYSLEWPRRKRNFGVWNRISQFSCRRDLQETCSQNLRNLPNSLWRGRVRLKILPGLEKLIQLTGYHTCKKVFSLPLPFIHFSPLTIQVFQTG